MGAVAVVSKARGRGGRLPTSEDTMLNKKIQERLNDQINHELTAWYFYLGASNYFEAASMKGFAHWMRVQAEEEQLHATRYIGYVQTRNGKVTLKDVKAQPEGGKSVLAIFETALKFEEKTTKGINDVAQEALAHGDHATYQFLQWFIGEQIEEEASLHYIIDKIKQLGDSAQDLFLLDRELATRPAPTPPPAGNNAA